MIIHQLHSIFDFLEALENRIGNISSEIILSEAIAFKKKKKGKTLGESLTCEKRMATGTNLAKHRATNWNGR